MGGTHDAGSGCYKVTNSPSPSTRVNKISYTCDGGTLSVPFTCAVPVPARHCLPVRLPSGPVRSKPTQAQPSPVRQATPKMVVGPSPWSNTGSGPSSLTLGFFSLIDLIVTCQARWGARLNSCLLYVHK